MIPAELPDLNLYKGDLWTEVYHFGPFLDAVGDPAAAPCLSCRMVFRSKLGNRLGYELNSLAEENKGTVTVIDGTNYEFDIPVQSLPLPPGEWLWVFQTFFSDDCTGDSLTWLTGKVIVSQV